MNNTPLTVAERMRRRIVEATAFALGFRPQVYDGALARFSCNSLRRSRAAEMSLRAINQSLGCERPHDYVRMKRYDALPLCPEEKRGR